MSGVDSVYANVVNQYCSYIDSHMEQKQGFHYLWSDAADDFKLSFDHLEDLDPNSTSDLYYSQLSTNWQKTAYRLRNQGDKERDRNAYTFTLVRTFYKQILGIMAVEVVYMLITWFRIDFQH